MKKTFSIFTAIVIAFSVLIYRPDIIQTQTVHAAVELTSEQIANYFNSRVGESYTSNMCLAFVADGFAALGGERSSACCAWNYGTQYLTSTSRDIPVGADVFFSSEGCKYDYIDDNGHHSGHIGVYVGDGYIVHAYSSKIQKMLISTVESHGYTYWGWGIHGGISLVSYSTKPSKPSVSVNSGDSSNPVKVSWNACENTTHYDIRFYNSGGTLVWAIGACDDGEAFGNRVVYTDTSYSHTFSAGSYYVRVAAVNNNTGEWNYADDVSFTVTEPPKQLTINYNANGGVIGSDSEYLLNDSGTILVKSSGNAFSTVWDAGSGSTQCGLTNATTFKLIKDGHNFLGWSLAKDSGTIFDQDDKTLISNDIYPDIVNGSARVTLYARWERISVKGDINADGKVDRTDLDLLQGWLFANAETELADWKAGDMNDEGTLNAIDYTLLKRKLLIQDGIILTLNKYALTLNTEGTSKTYQLTCSYPFPDDVVWSSSNPSIAKVSASGLVTAQKDGTAMITATANGNSVSCTVTVKTAYEETWSGWSDWSSTPISSSDSVEVKAEERSSQVLASYTMDCYTTRRADTKKRQFRNVSVNGNFSENGLDAGYGEYHHQYTFSAADVNAATVIPPGGEQGGSQNGVNATQMNGYSMLYGDAYYVFFITSENYETVYTTYYSSRHLVKTPVEYQN